MPGGEGKGDFGSGPGEGRTGFTHIPYEQTGDYKFKHQLHEILSAIFQNDSSFSYDFAIKKRNGQEIDFFSQEKAQDGDAAIIKLYDRNKAQAFVEIYNASRQAASLPQNDSPHWLVREADGNIEFNSAFLKTSGFWTPLGCNTFIEHLREHAEDLKNSIRPIAITYSAESWAPSRPDPVVEARAIHDMTPEEPEEIAARFAQR